MVVVLAGGVGAARFLRGLVEVVPAADITVIVNVADDLDVLGLRVCPDLDSITYWLSGLVHPGQQWGRDDERFIVRDELARLGHDPWFTLGDRDLALHLHRGELLARGVALSVVTAGVTRSHGLETILIPATDDRVTSRIHTVDGRDLHFQEYWVRERATPEVARVEYRGAEVARPAPGVVEAILAADAILVAPSNPVVSIAPITAIPGIAAALAATSAPVVGVSPIIEGRVVRGMADRLLPTVGAEVSAAGVAKHYRARSDGGLLDAWVVDERDAAACDAIGALGIAASSAPTMLDDVTVATALARHCLDIAASLRPGAA
jgi:LPPG:FO 2-phospho-L-lactate transferase